MKRSAPSKAIDDSPRPPAKRPGGFTDHRHRPGSPRLIDNFHRTQELVVGESLDDVPRRTSSTTSRFDLQQIGPHFAPAQPGQRASHRRLVKNSHSSAAATRQGRPPPGRTGTSVQSINDDLLRRRSRRVPGHSSRGQSHRTRRLGQRSVGQREELIESAPGPLVTAALVPLASSRSGLRKAWSATVPASRPAGRRQVDSSADLGGVAAAPSNFRPAGPRATRPGRGEPPASSPRPGTSPASCGRERRSSDHSSVPNRPGPGPAVDGRAPSARQDPAEEIDGTSLEPEGPRYRPAPARQLRSPPCSFGCPGRSVRRCSRPRQEPRQRNRPSPGPTTRAGATTPTGRKPAPSSSSSSTSAYRVPQQPGPGRRTSSSLQRGALVRGRGNEPGRRPSEPRALQLPGASWQHEPPARAAAASSRRRGGGAEDGRSHVVARLTVPTSPQRGNQPRSRSRVDDDVVKSPRSGPANRPRPQARPAGFPP